MHRKVVQLKVLGDGDLNRMLTRNVVNLSVVLNDQTGILLRIYHAHLSGLQAMNYGLLNCQLTLVIHVCHSCFYICDDIHTNAQRIVMIINPTPFKFCVGMNHRHYIRAYLGIIALKSRIINFSMCIIEIY